jgi:hypothetical protein
MLFFLNYRILKKNISKYNHPKVEKFFYKSNFQQQLKELETSQKKRYGSISTVSSQNLSCISSENLHMSSSSIKTAGKIVKENMNKQSNNKNNVIQRNEISKINSINNKEKVCNASN